MTTNINTKIPPPGLEPGTFRLLAECSNQLSYGGRWEKLRRLMFARKTMSIINIEMNWKLFTKPKLSLQKFFRDRELNPGHLRDRQIYSPLYYHGDVKVQRIGIKSKPKNSYKMVSHVKQSKMFRKFETQWKTLDWFDKMTAVGFEPTPFRTGAWSQRLRPLGHTVSKITLSAIGKS